MKTHENTTQVFPEDYNVVCHILSKPFLFVSSINCQCQMFHNLSLGLANAHAVLTTCYVSLSSNNLKEDVFSDIGEIGDEDDENNPSASKDTPKMARKTLDLTTCE